MGRSIEFYTLLFERRVEDTPHLRSLLDGSIWQSRGKVFYTVEEINRLTKKGVLRPQDVELTEEERIALASALRKKQQNLQADPVIGSLLKKYAEKRSEEARVTLAAALRQKNQNLKTDPVIGPILKRYVERRQQTESSFSLDEAERDLILGRIEVECSFSLDDAERYLTQSRALTPDEIGAATQALCVWYLRPGAVLTPREMERLTTKGFLTDQDKEMTDEERLKLRKT